MNSSATEPETRFSLLIPTRGNVPGLVRFLASLEATTREPGLVEVVLAMDEDDLESQAVTHDRLRLKKLVVPKGLTMGELNNACYAVSSGRYVMLMNDDVVLRTEGWDDQIAQVFASFHDDIALVHVNDLLFRERLCTFPMLSRRACEAIEVCPKVYRRYRIDDHIYDTYQLLAHLGYRRIVYLPDVVFEHENHVGEAATDQEHVYQSADQKVYVPKAGIIEADAADCDARFPERKQAALKLANLIETSARESALERLRTAGAARLQAVSDSHSYRRSAYVRRQSTGATRDTSNARTTVAVVTADLASELAQRCLASVKAHTRNYDLVVLDNNRGPNFSHSREMNKVLASADTEFVALLDDDVMVGPGWLDGLLRCMDDQTGAVVPLHRDGQGNFSFSGVYFSGDGRGTHAHTVDIPSEPRAVQAYCSAALLIDRRKCGHVLMDESYSKYFFDLAHALEVWEAGWKPVVCPDVVVTHLGGATLQAGSDAANALHETDRRTFVKTWIETGRLKRLAENAWATYPYLATLNSLSNEVEEFCASMPRMEIGKFEKRYSAALASTRDYSLFRQRVRGRAYECFDNWAKHGDIQKIIATLEADTGAVQPEFETRALVAVANRLFEAKQFNMLERLLLFGLQRHPDEVRLWRPLGYTRFSSSNLAGAQEAFEQALQRKPDDVEAWDSLGGVLFHLGDPANAAEAFERALACCRNNTTEDARIPDLKEKLETALKKAGLHESGQGVPLKPLVASAVHPTPRHPHGLRVLHIPLEFSEWRHARHVAYACQWGWGEELRRQGAKVLSLPMVYGWSEDVRQAWWRKLKNLCEGEVFDQVWLEIAHSPWSNEQLQWLASLAPVRLGLLMESLTYTPELTEANPSLAQRRSRVQSRLHALTHVLAVDEADLDLLRSSQSLQATWWPQAVPADCLRQPGESPKDAPAVFAGMVYGNRETFLAHPELRGLLRHLESPEIATRFPEAFDQLNAAIAAVLEKPDQGLGSLLIQHSAMLQRMRQASIQGWVESLGTAAAVVNLPSLFQGYAGRVVEGMAAGRPVITWEVPNRPRTAALFGESELLTFPTDQPYQLAEQIRRVQQDPDLARHLAIQAQAKVAKHHTLEVRTRQVLHWIATGEAPVFEDAVLHRFRGRFHPPSLTKGPSERSGDTPSAPCRISEQASPELNLAFGIAALQLDDRPLAQSLLAAVLQTRPGDLSALTALAELALRQGQLRWCVRWLDDVLTREPAQPVAIAVLIALLRCLGQLNSAERLASLAQTAGTVAVVAPGTPHNLERSDEILRRLDELSDLVVKGFSARSRPSETGAPPVARVGALDEARAHAKAGRNAQAWNVTIEAIQARPFHPEGWLLLGEIAHTSGTPTMTQHCAGRALALAPGLKRARKLFKGSPRQGKTEPNWMVLPPSLQEPNTPPQLTVCLITRNEERFLGACLESVKSLASQLVLVDTGSTDRTVEIARQHGAEIHHFEWCDDFSAARNAALEHARGDWVLVLDADEELCAEGAAQLKLEMQDPKVMAYRLPLVESSQDGQGVNYVPRLFRNAPGIRFIGRVHEHAFASVETLRSPWGLENRLGNTRLIHHGYSKEITRGREKIARNLRLLRHAIQESPHDPNLLLNLGLEQARSGDRELALSYYWQAFQILNTPHRPRCSPELREALLSQLSSHLIAARRPAEIVRLFESAVARAGELTASMHFILGLAFVDLKRAKDAARAFRDCLAHRNRPALTPSSAEVRSAAPRHCLARCLVELGDIKGAAQEYQAAVTEHPADARVQLDYVRFLVDHGDPVAGLHQLHARVGSSPDDVAAWQMGGEIALSRPDFLEFACDWTGEAIQHAPDDPVIAAQRAEALLLKGDAAAALDPWRAVAASGRPEHRAALILCELSLDQLVEHNLNGSSEAVSREFIRWYQRLAQFQGQTPLLHINARLPQLRTVLPLAAQVLEAAMNEVQTNPA